MSVIQAPFRAFFDLIDIWLDRAFGARWNPMRFLGALGFFCLWIVSISGLYLYIFFDTGITEAYGSIEYMTHDQWYLAGVMRSLHRYASDAMVVSMLVHMAREFALDRYRGPRWFTWFTGLPVFVLVIVAGISGYWLVWDRLAQYVALATTEWFDWLPIFGEPTARNFLSPESLDDRFFSLMIFIHIAVPLILLIVLWIHLQRVSRATINPPRGLAVGTFIMMLVLSLVYPAVSQAPADLNTVVSVVNLDWWYLGLYPLVDYWSSGTVWGAVSVVGFMLAALPWMPPMRRAAVAKVNLEHCNGCGWCVEDCPYNAIDMGRRTDGAPYEQQAIVNPALCVKCGICAGSCPSATPFRLAGQVKTGIDLPDRSLNDLRQRLENEAKGLRGDGRMLVLGCEHGAPLGGVRNDGVGAVKLPCIGNLPPSFVDYLISRDLVDGVMVTGCSGCDCFHRFGVRWTEERFDRVRDPRLRRRVPRERIERYGAGPTERRALQRAVEEFGARLVKLPKTDRGAKKTSGPPAPPSAQLEEVGDDG